MLGYAFMGKAHSNAFKKIAYITWPPPLEPRLVGIAGRNTEAVGEAAKRYGYEYATDDWRKLVEDDSIGLFDNGGPNSLHAEPTIAAAAGRQARDLREAARPRRRRELRDLAARRRDRRQAPLCVQLPLRAGVRLAREMIEAGELGEIRHFRGRYLQDWADDPSLDTWRFDADEAGSGALGDIGTHVIDLGALPERRDRVGLRLRQDVRRRAARSTTRSRRPSSSRTARSARSRRRASRSAAATRSSGRSTARRARSRSTWSA